MPTAFLKKQFESGWVLDPVKKADLTVRFVNDKTAVVTRADGSPLYRFIPPKKMRDEGYNVIKQNMYFGYLDGKWQYVK